MLGSHRIEQTRQAGGEMRRKPEELFANSFTAQLEMSGFLKQLWGNELVAPGR
jgi:hypothetical protein